MNSFVSVCCNGCGNNGANQMRWEENASTIPYCFRIWLDSVQRICLFVYWFTLFLCWFELTVYYFYLFFWIYIYIFPPSILPSFKHSIIQSLSQSFSSVIHLVYLQSICKHVVSYLPVQLLVWHSGITATAAAIKHRSYLCSMSNQIDVIATMPGEPCSKTADGLVEEGPPKYFRDRWSVVHQKLMYI